MKKFAHILTTIKSNCHCREQELQGTMGVKNVSQRNARSEDNRNWDGNKIIYTVYNLQKLHIDTHI